MVHQGGENVFSLFLVLLSVVLVTSPVVLAQDEDELPDLGLEFSGLVFDNVTEIDLFFTMVGDFTVIDEASGISGLLAYLWHIADLPDVKASKKCLTDVWTLLTDTFQFKEYALQMRAANGNPPRLSSIYFTHRLKYLGNFELCVGVRENEEWGIPMNAHVCDMTAPPHNVVVGLCAPASCSAHDLNVIAYAVLDQYDTVYSAYFSCIPKSPWKWDSIFVMFILSVFAIAAMCGTTFELASSSRRKKETETTAAAAAEVTRVAAALHRDTSVDGGKSLAATAEDGEVSEGQPAETMIPLDGPGGQGVETAPSGTPQTRDSTALVQKVILSFSVLLNGAGVLSAKKHKGNLGALNGMRVLSMWWIVWYHVVYFVPIAQRLDNPKLFYEGTASKTWFAITWQAPFAVDTFFVLSALLVTYLTLKQLDKSPEQAKRADYWAMFYVHRYIRLTPVYMICLGIFVSLLSPIGQGSTKSEFFAGGREICRSYWWTNLLYINNLVPYPGSVNLCMGWTWYLANDMQFYLLSPIFIILLFNEKTRKIGLIVLAAVTALSCIITAAVSGYWGYSVGNYQGNYNDRSLAFPPDADRNYAKPWCRIQAYTVGIFVGYILYRIKGKKVKINLALVLLGWVLALGTMATILFAMEGTSYIKPLPQWFAAIWLGLSRFFFAAAVGWVAFACVTGNGGPVDALLSWSAWLPLAKLNYCAYLLHPVVIFHFVLTKKVMFHYTTYEHIFYFWGCLVTTYLLSFFISLLVEVPVTTAEKVLLKRK